MTRDITLFVNPTAGGGRGARAAQPAARILRDAGFAVRTVLLTDAVGAPADLRPPASPEALRAALLERARSAVADGTGALIPVGGDGMTSLAVQAVAGTDTPLGVVAVGTGNDFARDLGLPVRDPEAAALAIADSLKGDGGAPVDLGRVTRGTAVDAGAGDPTGAAAGETAGGSGAAATGPAAGAATGEPTGPARPEPTWFATVLAAGFDSRVNDRANGMRWPGGRFRYDAAMLAELAGLRPIRYRIQLDDGAEQEVEAVLVAVGNGSSYGGGMRICGNAALDDGLFDVTVVGPCSRRTLLTVFPRVYRGTHLDHPVVTVHRVAAISLDAPDLTAYADGERLGPLPLTARAVPGAVRVLGARPAVS